MDPIQQILAQGQMGDKNGGLQQYYFEGQKLGQQQQQINLSKQRLLLEQRQQDNADTQSADNHLLAPLIRDHQSAVNVQTGAMATGAVIDAQIKAQQFQGLNQLSSLMLRAAQSPDGILDPTLQSDATIAYMQNPALIDLPQGAAFITNTAKAAFAKRALTQNQLPLQMQTVPNEVGGTDTFGTRNPSRMTSDLGKLYQDRKTALADGDFDAADLFDKRMEAVAAQTGDKSYAPSDMAKKIAEYHKALAEGDAKTIAYYESKLGITGLDDTDKALYRAGLAAINSDLSTFKAEDKQKKQAEFTSKFLADHNRKVSDAAATDARPALPAPLKTGAAIREEIRNTKDGRKAIFDANTKQFLRYAE